MNFGKPICYAFAIVEMIEKFTAFLLKALISPISWKKVRHGKNSAQPKIRKAIVTLFVGDKIEIYEGEFKEIWLLSYKPTGNARRQMRS